MLDERLRARGVHRIAVPVPFRAAGGPANVYAFEEAGGRLTLFDAGIKSAEGEQALRAGLAAIGRTFRDVERILISHGHIDHFGGARLIQRESGCAVFIHPLDRDKVLDATRHYRGKEHYAAYLARLGVSAEHIAVIQEGGDVTQSFAEGLEDVRDLSDGEWLTFSRCALQVLHLPGHTPGLVCLWDAEHRILYADDHLLEKISPNPLLELGKHGEEDKFRSLVTYLQSIRRAQRLPAEVICPGHGEPFAGHGDLIDGLLHFYEVRQERLLESLRAGERLPPHVDELDDLLRRGQAGDRSALSALIERYQQPVARLVAAELRSAGGEVSACEDVCQAAFVKIVLSLSRLRSAQTFEAWLFQTARNACRDHLRSQRWRRRLFAPLAPQHEAVESPVPATTEAVGERLQAAIARLDPHDRSLVSLTLERPRSYAELAQLLGLSISATKSRLFRTRARLGELLKEGGPDHDP